jgi:GTP-binding protein
VVDVTQKNPLEDLETIRKEIRAYNPDILEEKQILVFNKIDLLNTKKKLSTEFPTFYVSALTGKGVMELLTFLEKIRRNE